MKAIVGGVEVEGTPEEISAVIKAYNSDVIATAGATVSNSGRSFVDAEVAFKALKRRSLSPSQTALLKMLSDNFPDWTLATDIQKRLRYNGSQLAGLLGALGKRVAATPGYRPGSWFIDSEWDYDSDCYKYRLVGEVRSAVLRANL